ncbi:MAG: SCO family protein [Hyphomicrobiaceae bacterium]|nr:SCO family protein [Hyphomicrobiaceae bacterium]
MQRPPASVLTAIAGVVLAIGLLWADLLHAEDLGHKRPRGVNLAPLLKLVTHEGKPLDPSAIRRRPFVVAFGYTHCPDVCPTTLLDLTNQLADLGSAADQITVLFVTIDPERDTVAHLKSYLASFDSRIIGLTGNALDVAAAADGLEAFYERVARKDGGYTMDHTTRVRYFDRFGLLAANPDLSRTPPREVKTLLARLLAQ